ncbi:transposase-like protein [Paucibacter oligotrophus]|uniref:Transposase-like protein n=1 Tax=Roseateles oligotrophus TaxID=1769250 RepID=A0A840LLC5_9BURK|nr:transposase-like protein [Roseateles oligotrophus]
MAAVALANGLNANMLRKWVQELEGNPAAVLSPAPQQPAPSFIALPLPAAPAAQDSGLRPS